MTLVVVSLAAALSAILAHSILSRLLPISSVAAFMLSGCAIGSILIALLSGAGLQLYELCACVLIFSFVCELYLFLFTFSATSISAQIIATISQNGLAIEELQRKYSGKDMAMTRISRSITAGLITADKGLLVLTKEGRAFERLASLARSFFGHDNRHS